MKSCISQFTCCSVLILIINGCSQNTMPVKNDSDSLRHASDIILREVIDNTPDLVEGSEIIIVGRIRKVQGSKTAICGCFKACQGNSDGTKTCSWCVCEPENCVACE